MREPRRRPHGYIVLLVTVVCIAFAVHWRVLMWRFSTVQLAIACAVSLCVFNLMLYKINFGSHELVIGVIVQSFIAGSVLALSSLLVSCSSTRANHYRLGLFVGFLMTFHLSEFIFTVISNPKSLSVQSFLFDHSVEYWLANSLSLAEYFVEVHVFSASIPVAVVENNAPDRRLVPCCLDRLLLGHVVGPMSTVVVGIALCMVITGEIIRKTAMLQAGESFNHFLDPILREDHQLVTSGLYSLVRHPSYMGWFIWQAGMQALLGVPICFVAHTTVSIWFFSRRVLHEEYVLLQTFGPRYIQYIYNVKFTGIPFARGITDYVANISNNQTTTRLAGT